MKFRFLGPAAGNRIAAIVGVPGDSNVYYAGASSGGVWKTTDAGLNWKPIFDDQPVAAIGALALAPSDPSIVWAGTGEAWAIRDIDVGGDGVYKSVDAGKTWTNMGLTETGRIARVVVHPKNPDVVFVCAVGRMTGPQQERGVFRTTDGGQRWERVLFVDENTGCSGLSMDPNEPEDAVRRHVAGRDAHLGDVQRRARAAACSCRATAASKWTRIEGHGLPKSPVGKIDVAVAPTDSNRVYALIQTSRPGFALAVGRRRRVVAGRELAARPDRARRLLHPPGGVARQRRRGARGRQFLLAVGRRRPDVPRDRLERRQPRHLVSTRSTPTASRSPTTASVIITTNHGRSFMRPLLPIGQMYHVAVDNQVPYCVYATCRTTGRCAGR